MNKLVLNSREYWDKRFSDDWEKNGGEEQTTFFAEIAMQNLPESLKKIIIDNNLSILDWGCAEGEGTCRIKKEFKESHVVGLDFSSIAVKKAKKNYPHLEFINSELKENNSKFDVIFSSNCLEHFDNPKNVMGEFFKFANDYVILLLPFREFKRIPEHQYTFDLDSFSMYSDENFLVYSKIIDTSIMENSFWYGEQILVVYVNKNARGVESLKLTLADEFAFFEKKLSFNQSEIGKNIKTISDLISKLEFSQSTISDLISKLEFSQSTIDQLSNEITFMKSSRFWKLRRYYLKITREFNVYLFFRKYSKKFLPKEVIDVIFYIYKKLVKIFGREAIYSRQLNKILKKNSGKRIIIFPPLFEWNMPLFQRPQHIAIGLSDVGNLFFFCTNNPKKDRVSGFLRKRNNLFLTDQYDLIKNRVKGGIFLTYAADPNLCYKDLQSEMEDRNRTIVYEYVDEIHEDLVGDVASKLLQKHKEVLADERILISTTAQKLFNEVKKVREYNFSLVTNGVDINHFIINKEDVPKEISEIVNSKKPIIGYFGAFAKWFDYNLVKKISEAFPNAHLLLIGWDYDGTLSFSGIKKLNNVTVIGPIKYDRLPNFSKYFSVSTIPFLVNAITESTSPVKLFEYMAIGAPIVTTGLPECRKYKSVLVSENHNEFIENIKKAFALKKDDQYRALLKKEAEENTWVKKAQQIDELIEKGVAIDESVKTAITLLKECQNEISEMDPLSYYCSAYRDTEVLYWRIMPKWIVEDCKKNKIKRILDIGGGYGTLSLFFKKESGCDVYFIDFISDYINNNLIKKYNFNFKVCNIETEEIPWNLKFDVILLTEVIEHFNFHPLKTLKKLRKALADNGSLYLSTPDSLSWGKLSRYATVDDMPIVGDKIKIVDEHVYQFSKEELLALFDEAGFIVERFSYSPGNSFRHLNFVLKKNNL